MWGVVWHGTRLVPSGLPAAARCWILRRRFAARWMTSEGAACASHCLESVRFLGVARAQCDPPALQHKQKKASFRAERSEVPESITDGQRIERKGPPLHSPILLPRRGARQGGVVCGFGHNAPPRVQRRKTIPSGCACPLQRRGKGRQRKKLVPSGLPAAARCWILRRRFASRWMTPDEGV